MSSSCFNSNTKSSVRLIMYKHGANDYQNAIAIQTKTAGATSGWSSKNYLRYDGSFYASDAKITGEINATSGSFTGEINASSGNIGGIEIESKYLRAMDTESNTSATKRLVI